MAGKQQQVDLILPCTIFNVCITNFTQFTYFVASTFFLIHTNHSHLFCSFDKQNELLIQGVQYDERRRRLHFFLRLISQPKSKKSNNTLKKSKQKDLKGRTNMVWVIEFVIFYK